MAEDEIYQQEEYTANKLGLRREQAIIQRAVNDIQSQSQSLSSPSLFKWQLAGSLAIVNDIIDILVLTGILEILAWAISMILTAIIIAIVWLSNGRVKKMNDYTANIEKSAVEIGQMANRIEYLGRGTAGLLGKMPGLKKINIRKVPRKNPLARIFIGGSLESVPFLGALNLITVWVYFSYRAEQEIYNNAMEVSRQISESV